jgi:hypothetical protein
MLRFSQGTFKVREQLSATVRNVRAAALAVVALALVAERGAVAQEAAAAAGVSTGPNPEFGIPVQGWMLYPSFFAGMVFNDNLYSTAVNRVSGVGLRLRPALSADRDGEIHKTSVHVNADVQVYPGHGQSVQSYPYIGVQSRPTNVTGGAGFSHAYSPLPDWKFTVLADYTRNSGGLFGGSGFGASAPQVSVSNGATLTGIGTYSNQFTGSVGVEKQVERAFVRAAGGVQYVTYDSQPQDFWVNWALRQPFGPGSANQNSLAITASLRGGYWITPQVYAFVEPGGDFRRYRSSVSDTNGYRIIGGLGSDMISLFRGEIYGGYQAQTSAHGHFGTVGSPAFGARLYYYPTRFLTFTATLDQTLTAPLAQGVSIGGVTAFYSPTAPSRTLQARMQADYAITDYWTSFVRGGWGRSKSSGAHNWATIPPIWTYGPTTTIWTAGLGTSYRFWRNVALTFEYQFTKSLNPPNTGFYNWWIPTSVVQNLVTAGMTYRY